MPLSRDELHDKSNRASQGNRVSALSALEPMSSSAVGPNSQHLQNSLVSESRGEEACGKGVNMAGIKKRHTVTLSPHSRHQTESMT